MGILKFILNVIAVITAGLVGNWVGERWRVVDTGESEHELAVYQTDEDGQITVAVNPVMTNFVPAVLAGLLTRPYGWAMSFVVGVLTARFMGDQYEGQLDELISSWMPQSSEEDLPALEENPEL